MTKKLKKDPIAKNIRNERPVSLHGWTEEDALRRILSAPPKPLKEVKAKRKKDKDK
ncbi:MAG: hypothetical protein IPL32_12455 [Chloracidobacterium sp.]|nr:hypothetical protein [Chloracidobacterium sp.]